MERLDDAARIHVAANVLDGFERKVHLERRNGESIRGDRELSVKAMQGVVDSLRTRRAAESDSLGRATGEGIDELREQIVRWRDAPAGDALARPSEVMTRARILMRRLQGIERQMERRTRDIHKYEVEIQKRNAEKDALEAAASRTLTRSDPSWQAAGSPSACEAAALAAAGRAARLAGPRIVAGPVTCAIAISGDRE